MRKGVTHFGVLPQVAVFGGLPGLLNHLGSEFGMLRFGRCLHHLSLITRSPEPLAPEITVSGVLRFLGVSATSEELATNLHQNGRSAQLRDPLSNCHGGRAPAFA